MSGWGLDPKFEADDFPFRDVYSWEKFPVTGVKDESGERVGVRRELRDLKDDEDLWNLYLLGLHHWHKLPQDSHFSWKSIGGIHGYPYALWPPNNQELNDVKGNPNGNATFCTHTSILFLTWHRPYLALYEETLYKIVQIVAAKFTEEEGRDRYMKAAKRFRIPFWDFARRDRSTFPEEVVASDSVTVKMPAAMRSQFFIWQDSMDVTIHNPLYSYKWHFGTQDGFKINSKETTVRWDKKGEFDPEGDGADATVVKERLESNLRPFDSGTITHGDTKVLVEGNLTERVVYILQAYDRFYQFTSNSYAGPDKETKPPVENPYDNSITTRGGGYGSLEDIHNVLHELSGGSGDNMNGHMANVEFSSFDPVFWLLHANVDRLWALWQVLHDNDDNEYAFVTPQLATGDFGGHWVVREGGEQNVFTPLPPFYGPNGKLWDSNGVRYCMPFGYCYPETQSWNFEDQAALRNYVQTQISVLYSTGSLANMILRKKQTGTHEDEDRIWERAKQWLAIRDSEHRADTWTAFQMNKATTGRPSGPTSFDNSGSTNFDSFWNLDVPAFNFPTQNFHDHPSLEDLADNGVYNEWMFNIIAEKHSLSGRFEVHVFLGPVEETYTNLFSTSPNHVGTFFPLGQGQQTGCGKCQVDQATHQKITGQIPLTVALVERIFAREPITSLKPEHVVPYLQEQLHWEVVDQSGFRLDTGRDAVAGLQVSVTSNEVTVPKSLGFTPFYSHEVKIWPAATTLPNGHGRAEGTGTTTSNASSWFT